MLPEDLSPQQFLSTYWQKKFLLLKNALPAFRDPLSAEELAGLACEEEVESRLVHRQKQNWHLQPGPFREEDFMAMPDREWTLLVQAVDHWFPSVKKLLNEFSFIPDWRLDDVMLSYATEGAGVGPHFDYCDVFIVQGSGRRQWAIGQQCTDDSPMLPGTDLKILQSFTIEEEFVLESGDVLYIPPGKAHQSISLGDSMSYSIGFRAPSMAEIISSFAGRLCSDLEEDQRYADPDLQIQKNSAEINPESLGQVRQILSQSLNDETRLGLAFGELMTQRKYPELRYFPPDEIDADSLLRYLKQDASLEKHQAARFAFLRQADALILFADGESFLFKVADSSLEAVIMALCDRETVKLSREVQNISDDALQLLTDLYNQGTLIESE